MKAVILAGGIGSRLYPLSTEENPKQFLTPFNGKSLLEDTIDRVVTVSSSIHISTQERWVARIQNIQLPTDPKLIIEPCSRNTGPATAYAIAKFSDDDIVGFFPSDNYITPNKEFVRSVNVAVNLVKKNDTVVLLGVTPTEPHTGYGYIKHNGNTVISFKEKPTKEIAKRYLEAGNYLWNSGIFLFRVGKMKQLFKQHVTSIAAWLDEDGSDTGFAELEKISIDYAVMEKVGPSDIQVVPGSCTWSDLGSFDAL